MARNYLYIIGLCLLGISSKLKTRGESSSLWTASDLILEPIGYVLLGTRVMRQKDDKGTPGAPPPAPSSITVNMPSAPATAPPTP
jgi:hypothetical protein